MAGIKFFNPTECIEVDNPRVVYTDDEIRSTYEYVDTTVAIDEETGRVKVAPTRTKAEFRTVRNPSKTGLLLVGWGGNNGTTATAGVIANRAKMTWRTKNGVKNSNYWGSITQASTVGIGSENGSGSVFVPMNKIVPMLDPNDLVIGGWDISKMNLGDAMKRSAVLDVDLQNQLYEEMSKFEPMPSVYFPDFIAANQADRADNVLEGTKREQLEEIRKNIRDFKADNELEKVIVLWTANTERFAEIQEGVNDTADNLMASIDEEEEEISPSTVFAIASILEGCPYINGSPQNTFVPGVVELANTHQVFIVGDDFKSGQTKIKSVLVDFLVGAGMKPSSIVSWNHLGNNDGKNLSAPKQFRSKEISKSNVVDDMVASNGLLYEPGEHPDHVVVIKYVPNVGDSKRAMDEYTSDIFMGGTNTIAIHNTCEDSLLATPLIYDLVVLAELFTRVTFKWEGKLSKQDVVVEEEEGGEPVPKKDNSDADYQSFNAVLSLLSFLMKAPLVPAGTPVVNALFPQREALVNVLKALVGLPPEHHIRLQDRS